MSSIFETYRGINLIVDPGHFIELCESTALSPDGKCRPFGAGADGFVDGEGVGAVILKPLSAAMADGDRIWGVLKGSMVNSGGRTHGYTVPNPTAQAALVSEAMARSGVCAAEVSFIEAHGTGTSLGDPIEVNGLAKAFHEQGIVRPAQCVIGSVKGNIGHCESAAGMAGLAKVLLQMRYGRLAPTLNAVEPNPHIDLGATPFMVATEAVDWRRARSEAGGIVRELPRIAGISSFGAGGSNGHVVVAEPEDMPSLAPDTDREQAVVLSALTVERLSVMVSNLHRFITATPDLRLADIAFTLQVGRRPLAVRTGFVVRSLAELIRSLAAVMAGGSDVMGVYRGDIKQGRKAISLFGADEDLRQAIESWIAKGKIHKLTELWVQGLDVDWAAYQAGQTVRRIPLPTYPFVRERYWAPARGRSEPGTAPVRREVIAGSPASDNNPYQVPTENLILAPVWSVVPAVPVVPAPADGGTATIVVGANKCQRDGLEGLLPRARYVDPSEDNIADALRGEAASPLAFEHLIWITPDPPLAGVADDNLIESQAHGALLLFRLAKALVAAGCGGQKLHFTVVTSHVLGLTPTAITNPTHATIHGLVGSMSEEYPTWRFRALDLDDDSIWPFETVAFPDADVVAAGAGAAFVRLYRGGQWFARSLVPVRQLANEASPGRQGGVYVVIGGAGGLGEIWTRFMVRTFRANVFWIGRRPPDADIQTRIDAIAAFGPAPVYIQADARDHAAVRAAHAEIKRRFSAVHGIVHSAVGVFDRSLADMDVDAFREVLSAKLDVSVRMVQVFRHEPLDFVLFFSSVSSFLHKGGMTGYIAGSTFQDAYACYLAGRLRAPVKVVNWGYWNAGTGIAIPESSKRRMVNLGIQPLTDDEGMAGLQCLLASPLTQAVVIKAESLRIPGLAAPEDYLTLLPKPTLAPLESIVDRLPPLAPPEAALRAAAVFYGSPMEALLRRLLRTLLRDAGLLEAGLPKGLGFYGRWLAESRNFLAAGGASEQPCESIAALWTVWEHEREAWLTNSDLRPGAILVERCLRALPDILAGKIAATEVMFPNASMELVEGIYKGNLAADHFNRVLADTLVALVEAHAGDGLRILEIGAGTGGTSAGVLRRLKPFAGKISEYCYTDLSKAFLFHACENYAPEAPFLTTRTFNVAMPPVGQDLELGQYDVVIAANVLHATRNIRTSLRHTKALLRTGGTLLLNELSEASLVAHLTFGLLEGWWLNEDDAIRIPGSPGLTPATWRRVLNEEGFTPVIFPAAVSLELGQQIIAAQSDGVIRQRGAPPEPSRMIPAAMAVSVPAAAPVTTDLRSWTVHFVCDMLARLLRMDPKRIDPSEPLVSYGLDSILINQLTCSLREVFDGIGNTLLFDMPTIDAISDHLLATCRQTLAGLMAGNKEPEPESPVAKAVARMHPAPVQASPSGDRAIAIIGLSGRYPGANTLDVFWRNLREGRDCVTEIPEDRWSMEGFYEPDPARAIAVGASYSKWGGFIDGFADFDPLFFNISPQEAMVMDPQERLFLQIVWSALEDAGHTRAHLARAYDRRVGVFAGVTRIGYGLYGPEVWRQGNARFPYTSFSSVANRVSHFLDITGPSMPVDTMCSSSLTAIHEACEHILRGDCTLAIAGGVNLYVHPSSYANLSANRMLSPVGHCKSFGAGADGFVPGEGVGAVILKPLSLALRDGDQIHAVIRATHVNHGGKTHGYTVPSPKAQADLVRTALDKAGIGADAVTYVEAHGTGTELGDPIEIEGLTRAFRQDTDAVGFCSVGSVKSSIGHLEAAAGIAGLTKVVLQMRHGQLAPSLFAETENPQIAFAKTPFVVQRSLAPWPRPKPEARRIAGVSSFGAGGANAHVIVEEFPAGAEPAVEEAGPQAILFSARSWDRLRAMLDAWLDFTGDAGHPDLRLSDVAFTLQVGREPMAKRLAVTVSSLAELGERLRTLIAGWDDGPDTALVDGVLRGEAKKYEKNTKNFAGNADMVSTLDRWLAAGKLENLLPLWIDGAPIDWRKLRRGMDPHIVSLPTYPFAGNRYWIAEAQGLNRVSRPVADGSPETGMFVPEWHDVPGPVPGPGAHMGADWAERWILTVGLKEAPTPSRGVRLARLSVAGADPCERYTAAATSLLARLQAILSVPQAGVTLVQLLVAADDAMPGLSGLGAMLRTARAEHPALRVQLVEVQPDASAAELLAITGQAAFGADNDYLRHGERGLEFVQWRRAERHAMVNPWRQDGVYLITGGAGGLGRLIATHIANRAPRGTIILCGRGAGMDMSGLGCRIVYRQADVAVSAQIDDLVRSIETAYGRLDGVIHAAGVLRDGTIIGKQPDDLAAVLAPKVAGVWNLDRATQRLRPALFVLCSSCAAIKGNPGQSDYAAANGFLDTFAAMRDRRERAAGRISVTLSVNWPLWRDGGMRVRPERLESLTRLTGMIPMGAQDGLGALESGIAGGSCRMMVLHGHMDRLERLFVADPAVPSDTPVETKPVSRNGVRTAMIASIRETLMIQGDGECDERATFLELGIDSIHMVRFMATLSSRLGSSLRETLVFDHPTVGALADHLLSEGIGEPPLAPAPVVSAGRNPEPLAEALARHAELVPLAMAGTGPVLFCVHPMSGDVGIYSGLAQAVSGRFRVVGIRARGFLTDDVPLDSVGAMAEHYAALIAELHLPEPCHLLGTSMGGSVAYECTRRLRARGLDVASLVLVEAPLVATLDEASLWSSDTRRNLLMNANFLLIAMLHLDGDFRRRKMAGGFRWQDWEITEADITSIADAALVEHLVARVRARGVRQDAAVLNHRLKSMARIHLANLRAFAAYRAMPPVSPATTRVVQLRTASAVCVSPNVYNPDYLCNVQRAWGGMAPLLANWDSVLPGLDTRVIAGDTHFDLLGGEGAAGEMADLVAGILSGPKVGRPAPDKPAQLLSGSIAVIGMSGRFPGAASLDELWDLLRNGRTAFSGLPADRGWGEWGVGTAVDGIGHGAFLEGIDAFDPHYFRIPPIQAREIDPAERLFLEESWRAIRQAGIDPDATSGRNWGVFCGGGGDYTRLLNSRSGVSPHVTASSIPGRVSYSFGLTGPCVSVDAGCASSLLAVAQACDHLLLGHCEVAIAGGVYVHSTPNLIRASSRSGLLSGGDRSRVLDRASGGMTPAEGVGVLVLKPLSKALADGDPVQGVIEGWGVNHSGHTNGMAAPSGKAQRALFTGVLARHNVDPTSIGLAELNATGTPLGDRIEIEALSDVFASHTEQRSFCVVGSLENNIGHAFHASGVARLLKVLLAMRHGTIPPTVGVDLPVQGADSGPFELARESRAWPVRDDVSRRALVNSFGATGTNVQVIVRDPPRSAVSPPPLSPAVPFKRRSYWVDGESPVHRVVEAERTTGADHIGHLIEALVHNITGYAAGDIDRAEPLYRYGVDSMLSTRLLALINERFGVEIHLADLIDIESIDQLAACVAQQTGTELSSAQAAPTATAAVTSASTWLLERLSA